MMKCAGCGEDIDQTPCLNCGFDKINQNVSLDATLEVHDFIHTHVVDNPIDVFVAIPSETAAAKPKSFSYGAGTTSTDIAMDIISSANLISEQSILNKIADTIFLLEKTGKHKDYVSEVSITIDLLNLNIKFIKKLNL